MADEKTASDVRDGLAIDLESARRGLKAVKAADDGTVLLEAGEVAELHRLLEAFVVVLDERTPIKRGLDELRALDELMERTDRLERAVPGYSGKIGAGHPGLRHGLRRIVEAAGELVRRSVEAAKELEHGMLELEHAVPVDQRGVIAGPDGEGGVRGAAGELGKEPEPVSVDDKRDVLGEALLRLDALESGLDRGRETGSQAIGLLDRQRVNLERSVERSHRRIGQALIDVVKLEKWVDDDSDGLRITALENCENAEIGRLRRDVVGAGTRHRLEVLEIKRRLEALEIKRDRAAWDACDPPTSELVRLLRVLDAEGGSEYVDREAKRLGLVDELAGNIEAVAYRDIGGDMVKPA